MECKYSATKIEALHLHRNKLRGVWGQVMDATAQRTVPESQGLGELFALTVKNKTKNTHFMSTSAVLVSPATSSTSSMSFINCRHRC